MVTEPSKAIKIFYCYAHEDKALRDELGKHMRPLKRLGQITEWYDRDIQPGMEWAGEIDARLNTADIILLLISPDFMNSDYCWGVEMHRALERHRTGEARVIPIILRPVFRKGTPIDELQMLPTEGKPVTKWTDRDDALEDVTRGIHEVVETLLARRVEEERQLEEQHRKAEEERSRKAEEEQFRKAREEQARKAEEKRQLEEQQIVVAAVNGHPIMYDWFIRMCKTKKAYLDYRITQLKELIEIQPSTKELNRQELKALKAQAKSEKLEWIVIEELVDDVLIGNGIPQAIRTGAYANQFNLDLELIGEFDKFKIHIWYYHQQLFRSKEINDEDLKAFLRFVSRRKAFAHYLRWEKQVEIDEWLRQRKEEARIEYADEYHPHNNKESRKLFWWLG